MIKIKWLDIPIPKKLLVPIPVPTLKLFIILGTVAGFYGIYQDGYKNGYAIRNAPVTVYVAQDGSIPVTVYKGSGEYGNANERAWKYLKDNGIDKKLPPNYQLGWIEALGLEEMWRADRNCSIGDLWEAALCVANSFRIAGCANQPHEAARQTLLYLKKNAPGALDCIGAEDYINVTIKLAKDKKF